MLAGTGMAGAGGDTCRVVLVSQLKVAGSMHEQDTVFWLKPCPVSVTVCATGASSVTHGVIRPCFVLLNIKRRETLSEIPRSFSHAQAETSHKLLK